MVESIVVVGAGLAGLHTAQALREEGYQGRLSLLGAEPHLPYDRPPLSKGLLAGNLDNPTLPVDWSDLRVELRLGTCATGLRDGVVETEKGDIDFDALIVATGASPLRLHGGPQRVLRSLDEARALRTALAPGVRLVIVGAGWIGGEVATTAAAAGCRVTVVEAAEAPLESAIGTEVGRHIGRWYTEAGIELLLSTHVEAVHGDGLALVDGTEIPADEVLAAVGVRPELDWLANSPLVTSTGGLVVDEALRTNLPHVYAVGDCTAWWSRRFAARIHVEHWDNALRAPRSAAAALLGRDVVYDPVPYFWSEQHGRMLQYVGYHPVADELLWRGSPLREEWTVCWLRAGALVAVLTVDRRRDLVQARRLIATGAPVDRDKLADGEIPLQEASRSVDGCP